jgi:4-cresol dehydrogenase (hydroxylating)
VALPPGLSEDQFRDALREFADAVGREWVFAEDKYLESYRDPFSPLRNTDQEPVASAAVGPQSVEEVQQVLKIANDYGIPLWVISTGKNFGYGGPAGIVHAHEPHY